MAKLLRKCRKWFGHHGRTLWVSAVVLLALGAAVYYALTTNEEPELVDFGDATLSELALEVSDLSFEDGLLLLAEGEDRKGRAVMHRLAPLPMASKVALGNPKAHLWTAKELLAQRNVEFIEGFPLERAEGTALKPGFQLDSGEVAERCVRHLSAAVELDPSLDEAIVLLVELMLAQGERNEALEVLYAIVRKAERPELGVLLAHCVVYQGDDLLREEQSWKVLTVLGREVGQARRSDVGARMAYVLRAIELKQYALAESSIVTLQRDFPQRALAGQLRAQLAYFKAVDGLRSEPYAPEMTLEALQEARRHAPALAAPVSAMQQLTRRFPQLKAQVDLPSVDATLEATHPKVAAMLYAYRAELVPEQALGVLEKAWRLDRSSTGYLAQWVELSFKQSAGEMKDQEEAVLQALQQESLSQAERYPLLLALGQLYVQGGKWPEAVEFLEQALALGGGRQQEVHRQLGQAYQAMGQTVIADEHKALAGK